MRLRVMTALSVAVGCIGLTMARGQTINGDLQALQGSWWNKAPGAKKGLPETLTVMTIEGDTMTIMVTVKGRPHAVEGQIRINESANPKWLDVYSKKSVIDLGPSLGIYELNGDQLKVCGVPPTVPRPTKFQGNGIPLGSPKLVIYTRGEPPVSKYANLPKGAKIYEGAMIVEVTNRAVLLRTSGHPDVEVLTIVDKAFGLDGQPLDRPKSILKKGNIVDVIVTHADTNRKSLLRFHEARLVRGELAEAPKPKNATLMARQAMVTKINDWNVVLRIDGEEVFVFKKDRRTDAFDANGTLLPRGTGDRMLREGNVVEVIVAPKLKRELFARVREIRMVKGELLDEGK